MNKILFTKMHGLGNDFVIINAITQQVNIQKMPIVSLANRHIGIGFDQMLLIEPSNSADFFCRIFNADGNEAEQCGNGLRCCARFVQEEKLYTDSLVKFETKAGVFSIKIKDYEHISVAMGKPSIQEKLTNLQLSPDNPTIPVSILSLGNPHAILKVESIETPSTHQLGAKISQHSIFPNSVNVGFMQVMTRKHLRLRTFEKGVGETQACGSNACAAVVAGIANGWLDSEVHVELPYGTLIIEWNGGDNNVSLSGPASRVFSGEVIV